MLTILVLQIAEFPNLCFLITIAIRRILCVSKTCKYMSVLNNKQKATVYKMWSKFVFIYSTIEKKCNRHDITKERGKAYVRGINRKLINSFELNNLYWWW